jgi:hypothetical protein
LGFWIAGDNKKTLLFLGRLENNEDVAWNKS